MTAPVHGYATGTQRVPTMEPPCPKRRRRGGAGSGTARGPVGGYEAKFPALDRTSAQHKVAQGERGMNSTLTLETTVHRVGDLVVFVTEADVQHPRIRQQVRRDALRWIARNDQLGVKRYRFDRLRPDGTLLRDAF